jgi:hypothetical protein
VGGGEALKGGSRYGEMRIAEDNEDGGRGFAAAGSARRLLEGVENEEEAVEGGRGDEKWREDVRQ